MFGGVDGDAARVRRRLGLLLGPLLVLLGQLGQPGLEPRRDLRALAARQLDERVERSRRSRSSARRRCGLPRPACRAHRPDAPRRSGRRPCSGPSRRNPARSGPRPASRPMTARRRPGPGRASPAPRGCGRRDDPWRAWSSRGGSRIARAAGVSASRRVSRDQGVGHGRVAAGIGGRVGISAQGGQGVGPEAGAGVLGGDPLEMLLADHQRVVAAEYRLAFFSMASM